MAREAVKSSNIKAIGYDKDKKLLEVEFYSGSTYQYTGVGEQTFKELKEADSVGRYFMKNIKGSFDYKRID